MISKFSKYAFLIFLLSLFALGLSGQEETRLSQKLASGIAELRQDFILRRETYRNRVKSILVEIDSSNMEDQKKLALIEYIQEDFAAGGRSNNLDLFYELPKNHPLRTAYLESYVANNEDFYVDQEMLVDFITMGLFDASNVLKTREMDPFLNEFELLNIQANDRILFLDARQGAFAMLTAYIHEGVEITIHNMWQDLHFKALDRMDRYPNVNNGNVIEFLLNESERLQVEGQVWDKIIIRNNSFLLNAPQGSKLNSLHDNLSSNGAIFLSHVAALPGLDCGTNLKREKIIKTLLRSKFKFLEEVRLGCKILFKFKSIKDQK